MIIPAKTTTLVIGFGFIVRWVAIKETLRAVILVDELYTVLVLNYYILQPSGCGSYEWKVSPHGVGLTSVAVHTGGVAVADEGIIIGRPPYIREDSLSVQHIFHVLEIQTGVEHEGEFLFQLVRVFPHTAVQVHKVAMTYVPTLA